MREKTLTERVLDVLEEHEETPSRPEPEGKVSLPYYLNGCPAGTFLADVRPHYPSCIVAMSEGFDGAKDLNLVLDWEHGWALKRGPADIYVRNSDLVRVLRDAGLSR